MGTKIAAATPEWHAMGGQWIVVREPLVQIQGEPPLLDHSLSKEMVRELGLRMHKTYYSLTLTILFPNPNHPQTNKTQQGEVRKMS